MTRAVWWSFIFCYLLQFTLHTTHAQIPVFRNLETIGQGRTRALLQANQIINVLVWNIHKAEDTQWFSDTTNIIGNKDFVLFQEAVYPDEIVDFFRGLGPFEWAMASSFRLINSDFSRTGVTTASKYKSSNREVITTMYTEPVVSTPKVSLYTTYQTKKGELLVANVHAINFVSDFNFLIELIRIEKRLAKHKGPLILGGDFNTWSSSRTRLLKEMAERHNLNAVPFADRERRITLGYPLDHIYYRGLTLLKREDLSYINSSDHLPLSVQFQL